MKKKRVMFLIESMVVGGAECVLLHLVNNLDLAKYDITVLSVFKNSVYPGYNCQFSESLPAHVNYSYLINNENPIKYKLFNIAFNRGCKRILHKLLIGNSFDVEIAWYEGLPTTFIAHSSNKSSRKLAWLHYGDGFSNLTSSQRLQYQKEYVIFDQIVGVSNGVCKNFRERIGKTFPLITRYNILDDVSIRNKARAFKVDRPAVTTFITVGRLIQVKGYDRLLQVCGKLKNEGFRFNLWMIGEGSEHDHLMEIVQKNNLELEVSMLGNKDNPYPYMLSADWFISSSFAEGFSTVLTEACILSTPMISTRCAGTSELIGENSEYGLMAVNSENGIYEKMKMVLEQPCLHEKYVEKTVMRSKYWKKENLLKSIEEIL